MKQIKKDLMKDLIVVFVIWAIVIALIGIGIFI
jgi:hypothetical protein